MSLGVSKNSSNLFRRRGGSAAARRSRGEQKERNSPLEVGERRTISLVVLAVRANKKVSSTRR